MCSIIYILARTLISHHSKRSIISQAIGKDLKGIISIIVYALGIGMAFVDTKIAIGCYIVIATMWFLPDRRIENSL